MSATALLSVTNLPASVRQTLTGHTSRALRNAVHQRAHYGSDLLHSVTPSSRQQQWRDGGSSYMLPSNTILDADDLRPEIGQRVAHFLKLRYLDARAKRCAEELGVKIETAQGWLEGRMPQNKYFVQMLRTFGAPFAAFVLEPCGAWVKAWEPAPEAIQRADNRLAAIEDGIAALAREVAELKR